MQRHFPQSTSYRMFPSCAKNSGFKLFCKKGQGDRAWAGLEDYGALGLPPPDFSTIPISKLTFADWVSPWDFFYPLPNKPLWGQWKKQKIQNPQCPGRYVSSIYEWQVSRGHHNLTPLGSSPPANLLLLNPCCRHSELKRLGPMSTENKANDLEG